MRPRPSRALPLAACLLLISSGCVQHGSPSGGQPGGPAPGAGTPAGTLVVSNMNDNTATVLDAATGRVLGTLPTGTGPHEVAVSHDGRWAVVTNYGVRQQPGSSLTLIDVSGVAVARTIDLGQYRRPHGAAFFPGDTTLAVTSEAGQVVLFVDLRTDRVVTSRPTSGRVSHMLAMSASGDRIFTTNIADGSISRIDPSGGVPARVTAVAKAVEGITITPDGKSVWVGSNGDSLVVILNADGAGGAGGTVAAARDTIRGFGMPYRLAASPNGRLVVITDPVRAEVRVFDVASRKQRFVIAVPHDSLVATAEVPGSPSPEGVTISRDSRWAFVTLQGRNRVATIDLDRGSIIGYAPTGTWSDGIAYSPVVARPR